MNWLLIIILIGDSGLTNHVIEFKSKQTCLWAEAFYRVEAPTKQGIRRTVVSNCVQGE
jgi:hypothetical protein